MISKDFQMLMSTFFAAWFEKRNSLCAFLTFPIIKYLKSENKSGKVKFSCIQQMEICAAIKQNGQITCEDIVQYIKIGRKNAMIICNK